MSFKNKYLHSEQKVCARKLNIDIFRKRTKLHSIPLDKTYWTLANIQDMSEATEIVQLHREGFLLPSQFHGVDRDPKIIEDNRRDHPDAHWHCGEWNAILDEEEFNPAFVYLDTTSVVDKYAATALTVKTMLKCPPSTILVVNVMENNPRENKKEHHEVDGLLKNINTKLPCFAHENWETEVENYTYQATQHTKMRSFIFERKK